MSMLYTMKGAREAGYEPIAALRRSSRPALHALYNDAGFETVDAPWVPMFITSSGSEGKWWNPIVWKNIYVAYRMWAEGKRKLNALVEAKKIDLVHLNSVGLSNCAEALTEAGTPFVWHVREYGPVRQGRRYQRIRSRLEQSPHVIFLSKAEQRSWLGHNGHGTVIHNFIDFDKFDDAVPLVTAKQRLGIRETTKVILFVGGSKDYKGVIELLQVLGELKATYGDDFVCLMPDSAIKDEKKLTKVETRMAEVIREKGIADNCRLLPFNPDIVGQYAACDVLVFPATKPHFARPVIEASAMGKPVIASDLEPIDELVVDGETGYLVPVGDEARLLEKLTFLFEHTEVAARLGENGKAFARAEFDQRQQMQKILQVYDNALEV